jgi:hypothetical protein
MSVREYELIFDWSKHSNFQLLIIHRLDIILSQIIQIRLDIILYRPSIIHLVN